MSNKLKEIDIKNRTYYFFDDMINTKIRHAKAIQKYSYLLHWLCES